MAVRYTRHARYKFEVLERYGFPVTEQQVTATLSTPDAVIAQPEGRYIAQKRITERHVLRVVYLPGGRRHSGDHFLPRQEGAI